MGKRIWITLCVATLAAGAWGLMRSSPAPNEGLVVEVEVLDQAGHALPKAQVEQVFRPGWQAVDRRGHQRLTHLALRAGEGVSPEALRAAVHVRARFYTLRQGFDPEVRKRADGSWALRFLLHHHGVLRLIVAESHLGAARAFLEPDPLHRWEAMDRGNVARPGSPAAYRIYPGFERIAVRLVGEPDRQGAVGIATRHFFLPPPDAGYVVERTLEPDAVQPILGSVLAPPGPSPPSLGGRLRVSELTPEGARLPLEEVRMQEDGSFVVRTVGAGDYELTAHLDYFPEPLTVLAAGGDVAKLRPPGAPCWAVLEHRGRDLRNARALLTRRVPGGSPPKPSRVFFGQNHSLAPLPGTGSYAFHLDVAGSQTSVPLQGNCLVDASDVGPTRAVLKLRPAPSATLVVHTTPESWQQAHGARLSVAGREATLLQGLSEGMTLSNLRVPAAGGRVLVRIDWDDPAAAPSETRVALVPDQRTQVTLARHAGGRLRLRAAGAAFAMRTSPLPFRYWIAQTDRQQSAFLHRPRNHRRGARAIWDVEDRLPAGRYRGSIAGQDEGEAAPASFAFEIRAGQTTVANVGPARE